MAKSSFFGDIPIKRSSISIEIEKSEEKKETSYAPQFLGYLFSVRDQAHLAHLRVSGIGAFSAHMALGEFYSGLTEFIDELTEVYQGMYGIIPITIPGSTYVDGLTLVKGCREYIDQNRMKFCDESHIQNIIDEIVALIDRTIYKLENLK